MCKIQVFQIKSNRLVALNIDVTCFYIVLKLLCRSEHSARLQPTDTVATQQRLTIHSFHRRWLAFQVWHNISSSLLP